MTDHIKNEAEVEEYNMKVKKNKYLITLMK